LESPRQRHFFFAAVMIGTLRAHVDALALGIDRPSAGEEARDIAHPEAAESWRLNPVRRQVGLVDSLRVPAGGARVRRGARDVGASTRGKACRP